MRRRKEIADEGTVDVYWEEKGKDTLPILMQLVAFGSEWYADVVFEDKMPRKLNEIFPQPEAREIIRGLHLMLPLS
jgi:DNA-binding HxlR family transcriptional regulator